MSLKKNILANYASQLYITLIGIVTVPLYIKYMGAEAYGLVGFFAMLQAWFNLLDMGMTPTIARETACFRGGASDALKYRLLIRSLEGIFLLIALIGSLSIYLSSVYIANNWLKSSQLPIIEIKNTIELIAIVIALRWMSGLYRSIISGSERLVWLSKYNLIIATLRFVAVLPILAFIGATPTVFFSFQLIIAIIEFCGVLLYAYQLLPSISPNQKLTWCLSPIRPTIKFSLSIAFTSSLWIIVTQTDKLLLSTLLPLQDYAYFTLAVLGASAVGIVSTPINSALLPRMTKLNTEGNDTGVIELYRYATQFLCIATIPTVLILAFFSEQVLWIWTGNIIIAEKVAPILMPYAIGNGILAIGSIAYYLQFAKGDLRLHLIETPIFLIIFLPGLLWSIENYGIKGAGYAWLGTMVIIFSFWLPVIHHRFFNGQHISWLVKDIGPILCLNLIIINLGYSILLDSKLNLPETRSAMALVIILLGIISTLVSAMGSKLFRKIIHQQWHSYFKLRTANTN